VAARLCSKRRGSRASVNASSSACTCVRREHRLLYRNEKTPYRDAPFESILPALRRWYVATRLQTALAAFYQNARARLELQVI